MCFLNNDIYLWGKAAVGSKICEMLAHWTKACG